MREKIFFENSKGDRLCGILSNPTKDKGKPIIILCHGFSTSKNSNTYVSLGQTLNKTDISTFRFDFYGHGESEGKFEEITTSEAVDDVLNAIKFLKSLGYAKIGLMGGSFGGIASIMAASKTNDLFVLALKSPVSNYEEKEIMTKSKKELEEWKRKGYRYYVSGDGRKLRLNYTFYEDFKNNNGYQAARKIKIPTLIVHGDKDKSVPIEQSKKTANLIKECKLEIIKGADHGYSKPKDREKMLFLISDFLIKNSI
jgi:hypothetical protein